MSSANNIGVVILAAGASTRLGKPKQLLKYKSKTLLQNAIDAAIQSDANSTIVVLGANADKISSEIDRSGVTILVNNEWEEGMASSVRNGLNELLFISTEIHAAIFMVCDQPYISSSVLNELIITRQRTTKGIVTCDYGGSIGPPALFDKKYFPELMKLLGDAGARKIIQQNMDDVATVSFPNGKIDIDTIDDYEKLMNS